MAQALSQPAAQRKYVSAPWLAAQFLAAKMPGVPAPARHETAMRALPRSPQAREAVPLAPPFLLVVSFEPCGPDQGHARAHDIPRSALCSPELHC